MNIEEIVRNIIIETLTALNKKIVLFISGGSTNVDKVLKTLASFSVVNYEIVMSETAKELIDKELIEKIGNNIVQNLEELDETIKSSELILIPVMTRNTLAKSAIGIADNLVTTGISRALMLDKEIIAVKDSFDFENSINISSGLSKNTAYNSMILNYEKTLEGFGIKFIDSFEFKGAIEENLYSSFRNSKKSKPRKKNKSIKNELKNTTKKESLECKSSILTVGDIMKFTADGVIFIRQGTMITPLAKDYIYNNKLRVEFVS